jgi:FkbH-like protein
MTTQSPSSPLLDRLRRSLDRDQSLPASHRAWKAIRAGTSMLLAPLYLLPCDRVGAGARSHGRPVINNAGSIAIGDRAILNSMFAPVRLSTGPRGQIVIGDDAAINFGTSISAEDRVTIGHRVSLGPYVTLADSDGDDEANGEAGSQPIVIGDDVWLAARVRVRKGAVIGDGAVITAGSTVEGEIPAGVVAGGVPARVLRRKEPGDVAKEVPSACAPAALTTETDVRGLLISDFSVQELALHLRAGDELGPTVDAVAAPFDQVVQTLLGLDVAAREHRADFAVVWTRPESIAAFHERLLGQTVSLDAILAEVDAFAARIKAASGSIKHLFVPTWVLPPHERGLGIIDLREGGAAHALLKMNLRLIDALAGTPNVFVLDAARWMAAAGKQAGGSKLWFLGKVGYAAEVFAEAARDLRAALRGLRGAARKLIVLDLDDTLWGGIVGDVGWENLRLGGHDAEGEAFVELQSRLKALSRRGVLLAVVSKNEESVALEAIARHPAMVLKLEDLAGYKINWRDKAANIAELVAELNLGLQSVVFLDDNPVERARVREALREVFVPDWPEDKLACPEALHALRCFDTPTISREDLDRTRMYAAERGREAQKKGVGSLDDWLAGLGTHVRFARLDATNLARTTQLLNKTNQMNLSTRRLGEAELMSWAHAPGHEVWAVNVADSFGDAGLTGILGIEREGTTARVVDYVLSCRVMGRRVEETMLAAAVQRARELGAETLEARHLPTAKNKPCLGLLQASCFHHDDLGSTFRWSTREPYPRPRAIVVEGIDLDANQEIKNA